jgi:hypothetical protein
MLDIFLLCYFVLAYAFIKGVEMILEEGANI